MKNIGDKLKSIDFQIFLKVKYTLQNADTINTPTGSNLLYPAVTGAQKGRV